MAFVRIMGTGYYLPKKVVTNDDLSKCVDTSDEWIRTRTGIVQRHIAANNEACSDLALQAAKQALTNANIAPEAIDLLIVATVTADMQFPSTAAILQAKLGLRTIMAFDINAACSGFVYALDVARHFLTNRVYRYALVIGSDKLSAIVNWKDRNTCVLFGDGAGACVLGQSDTNAHCVVDGFLGADGSNPDWLCIPAGGSLQPATATTVANHLHFVSMNGREVFKVAVRRMMEAVRGVLERQKLTIADIQWIVPHQANLRIIQALADELGFPMDRMICNIDQTGNTSAASIPVALAQAEAAGRFHPGERILLVAFGGGLTWGASLIQY